METKVICGSNGMITFEGGYAVCDSNHLIWMIIKISRTILAGLNAAEITRLASKKLYGLLY